MEKKIIIPKNTNLVITEDCNDVNTNSEIVIELQSGGHLTYVIPIKKKLSDFKIKRTAIVHANAEIIWFDLNDSDNTIESEILTKLIEPAAHAKTYGLFYGKDHAQFTISHCTEHLAPNTHSIMEIKGVLDNKSRASMRSLIKIYPGMTGCTGHERADTLLLSKNAHIDAVPELEIENNDVQCTHAVTTTRLSRGKLFYLEGRGLNENEARKLLVDAHFYSILEKIPCEN